MRKLKAQEVEKDQSSQEILCAGLLILAKIIAREAIHDLPSKVDTAKINTSVDTSKENTSPSPIAQAISR
jgi:hypothetical protein